MDALARYTEQLLQRKYPGTVWEVDLEWPQDRLALESAAGEIDRPDSDGIDDKEVGFAA